MKIKDLSSDVVEQLVALEVRNILPVLASVGLNLTEKDMEHQFVAFKDSEVVVAYDDDGDVAGFVMYEVKGSEVMIISFNLRQFNNANILFGLLGELIFEISESNIILVKSRAHHTNKRSLNFHRRMGFQEVSKTDQFIEFQIDRDKLLMILKSRLGVFDS